MSILTFVGFILLGVFILLFLKEKRRISLAFLLTFSISMFFLSLLEFLEGKEVNEVLQLIALGIFFGLIPLGILCVSFYLFLNGRLMLKREGKRVANLLSLLVSLGIIIMVGLVIYFSVITYDHRFYMLYITILLIFLYFLFLFMSYFLYAILYHFIKITYRPDFIIVLGSGLIGDRVPPLLASRLDKGMEEYMKYNKHPKIIVSGGQGPDELVSEASAMKQYLVTKGMNEQDILMENKSRNTLQNMKFSKNIMDSIKTDHTSIFVTNNYHVFRASIYARLAGLKCEGIGSHTAMYYLPSAFIREYIGILVMYKWWHVFFVSSILLFIFISS